MKPLFIIVLLLYSCNKCYNESNAYIKNVTLKNKLVDSLVSCTQFNFKFDSSSKPIDSVRTVISQNDKGIELSYFNPRNGMKFIYVLNYLNSTKVHTFILKADAEDDCGYRYPKLVQLDGQRKENKSNQITIEY